MKKVLLALVMVVALASAACAAVGVVDVNKIRLESKNGKALTDTILAAQAKLDKQLQDFRKANPKTDDQATREKIARKFQELQTQMNQFEAKCNQAYSEALIKVVNAEIKKQNLELALPAHEVIAVNSAKDITAAVMAAFQNTSVKF
ncbi:MAG: hypothetical protein Q4C78_04220 [Synergistaceae bacterium]|nr:hypothetical protein [Synergistaceae bacterium]